MQDVTSLLKREGQLNLIAYIIIICLLALVAILVLVLVSGIGVADLWLVRNQFVEILLLGLLLAVIVYMADTHRRLRSQLERTHNDLIETQDELALSCDRIAFAHQIATTVASLSEQNAIRYALKESARRFRADAVAIVTDDVEVFADDAHFDAAYSIALNTALEAVQSGGSDVFSLSRNGYEVMAAPLRVQGHLQAIACLMRRGEPFFDEDAKGLELLARVLELGVQNRALLTQMHSQIGGVLTMFSSLLEDRQSNYTSHAVAIANFSVAVGAAIGMPDTQLEDLRLAALLHDVGMLAIPQDLINPSREMTPDELVSFQGHPAKGAELARFANFDPHVQEAILAHHERLDGSGYPRHLKGLAIPLSSRIITVCDSFDAMTHERPGRRTLGRAEAISELKRRSGITFDPKVVRAFIGVLEEEMASDSRGLRASAAERENVPA